MENTFKSGDRIRVTYSCLPFFATGDTAVLVFQDEDGDWWAKFDLSRQVNTDDTCCIDSKGFEKLT